MKTIVCLGIALSLPFLGRFQETTVFQNGKIIFEQSTYDQKLASGLMIVASIILVVATLRERKKLVKRPILLLARFTPALFALPASWQNWSVSQYGDASVYTQIKSGLGGPMTSLLILAAAGLFIAIDAYWRRKEEF